MTNSSRNAILFSRALRITTFILLILGSSVTHAQIYVSNYTLLGVAIGTESQKPINLELRLGTNNKIGGTILEVAGFYHLHDGDYHSISAGLAINLDPFGEQNVGIIIPVELEVFPAPGFRRIALAFEVGPDFELAFDEVELRHLWAIRYYFSEPD